MKKASLVFLFLFFLSISIFPKEISEKEGMKILKQIRKEIEKEKRSKLAAKKAENKNGKKIIKEIQRDINESLEEKVFRSDDNPETRIAAAIAAFEIGKKRMSFLKIEEKEIIELEKVLDMETDENRVFLSQKFDEVYDKFKANINETELLLSENEELKKYLDKLNKMEHKVKIEN